MVCKSNVTLKCMCLCSLLTSRTEIQPSANKYNAKWVDSKCQNTAGHSERVSSGLFMSMAIKIQCNYEEQKNGLILMDVQMYNRINYKT